MEMELAQAYGKPKGKIVPHFSSHFFPEKPVLSESQRIRKIVKEIDEQGPHKHVLIASEKKIVEQRLRSGTVYKGP